MKCSQELIIPKAPHCTYIAQTWTFKIVYYQSYDWILQGSKIHTFLVKDESRRKIELAATKGRIGQPSKSVSLSSYVASCKVTYY